MNEVEKDAQSFRRKSWVFLWKLYFSLNMAI
jgi:hypothetical protein